MPASAGEAQPAVPDLGEPKRRTKLGPPETHFLKGGRLNGLGRPNRPCLR
jgi:hypothetical protein